MKARIIIPIIFLAGCAAPPPGAGQRWSAVDLAGRIAGPPQRCVPIRQAEGLRISENDPHVLLYGNGRTIWANNLGGCRFGSDDVLVTEPIGSAHCRGDIVRSIDRVTHIPGPACVLSDFVPYTR